MRYEEYLTCGIILVKPGCMVHFQKNCVSKIKFGQELGPKEGINQKKETFYTNPIHTTQEESNRSSACLALVRFLKTTTTATARIRSTYLSIPCLLLAARGISIKPHKISLLSSYLCSTDNPK
jgi:hypothetical protein